MFKTALSQKCVLFPGALGDFICFLPALNILQQSAQVDLFARAEFEGLVSSSVRVWSLERFEVRRLYAPEAAEDKQLKKFFAAYASVDSWTGYGQAEFVSQLLCVSEGRVRVHPFRPAGKGVHQADYYLSCVTDAPGALGVPNIALQSEWIWWSETFWRTNSLGGKAVLCLGPGSGAKEKNWPAEFYRAVAEWWRKATGGAVVVLLGPVEEERKGSNINVPGSITARHLNLPQVAALLARSDLYLGNDSGLTHLAAASGVCTVALFGPSDIRQWAPRGKKVVVLSRNVECSPCDISIMKSCEHRRCLSAFSPGEVIAQLQTLPPVAALTRGGARITV